jgi:serine-type D-Ala-D-Ala carboxypeptidase/endopeptidase (penicillin-binding protein 4)
MINKILRKLILSILMCSSVNAIISMPSNYVEIVSRVKDIVKKFNSHVHIGIEIISLKDGEVIYQKNGHHLFVPASTMKMVTAAAAFSVLGPQYIFKTTILTDGVLDRDKLVGNLYVKGAGDPSLTDADLEKLIRKLGIQKIQGNVCLDLSEFDDHVFGSGSILDNIKAPWNKPVGALVVSHSCADIVVDSTSCEPLIIKALYPIKYGENILKKWNISYTGRMVVQRAPEQAYTIAEHSSRPLHELISHMMKTSDNLYADCIFKKMGSVCHGIPGTWRKGMVVVKDFLEKTVAIDWQEVTIRDGSGRSRYNALSPHHVVKLLQRIYNEPYASEFIKSLAIAGVDGTLKNRMKEMAGQIKAKTGFLFGVSALSGYIGDNDKEELAFSILINGFIPSRPIAGLIDTASFKTDGVDYQTVIEDAICQHLIKLGNPNNYS